MEEDINDNIIKYFEQLKINKEHIANIDTDFFFDFVENLIKRNKELEEKNIKLQKRNNRQFKLFGKRYKEIENLKNTNKTLYELCQGKAMQEFINNECDYIPKSKVREKIEKWESICRAEQLEGLNDNHAEYWNCFEDVLEKIKEQLLQEGDK